MELIGNVLLVFVPIILAGICNMIFVKIKFLDFLKTPMDNGIHLKDGKRLFGNNKTWKGFFGMIFFSAIWMGIMHWIFILSKSTMYSIVAYQEFSYWWSGLFYGAVFGLFYVLFELPNSYIKRRLEIQPGKSGVGFNKYLFMLIDQADSVIGCGIALLMIAQPSVMEWVMLLVLGTLMHYVINILLFFVRLKNQAG